jgi:hypothetical protein
MHGMPPPFSVSLPAARAARSASRRLEFLAFVG